MTTEGIIQLFKIKFDGQILAGHDEKGNIVFETSIGKILFIRMVKSGTIVGTVKAKEWVAVNNGVQTVFDNPLLFNTDATVIVCFPKGTNVKVNYKDSCNLYVVTQDKLQKAINTIKKVYGYVPPKYDNKKEEFTDTLEDLLITEEETHREFTDKELYAEDYSRSNNLAVMSNVLLVVGLIIAVLGIAQFSISALAVSLLCGVLGFIKFKTSYSLTSMCISAIVVVIAIVIIIVNDVNCLDANEIFVLFDKIDDILNKIVKFVDNIW